MSKQLMTIVDKLRRIVLEKLTPTEHNYIKPCINWLKKNTREWFERTDVISNVNLKIQQQKKYLNTYLTTIYQQKCTFTQVNERTSGLLIRKKSKNKVSRVEMRYND